MTRTYCILSLLLVILICCKQKRASITDIVKRDNGFVDNRYIAQAPLAQLINMGDYVMMSDSFTIDRPTSIRTYAVGEILFNLPDDSKKYYLRDDDIDLFIEGIDDAKSQKNIVKHFHFSYARTNKDYEVQNIKFKWKNIEDKQYLSEIGIPWKSLGISYQDGSSFNFDISIGDNDDGFIQTKKIAWSATSEMQLTNNDLHGKLVLKKGIAKGEKPEIMISTFASPKVDGEVEKMWATIPEYTVNNSLMGFIKGSYDLSAQVKSSWDKDNLYFLVNVKDSRQKKITLKKLKERGIFTDYAWIEDEKGERVWTMEAKYSRWAGGAYKNQKIDTLLNLKPGVYTVKYSTDEDHSYNNWNSKPPETPFYGVVVYENK